MAKGPTQNEINATTKAIEAACGVTNDGVIPADITLRQGTRNLAALHNVLSDHLAGLGPAMAFEFIRSLMNDLYDTWERQSDEFR